MCGQHAIKQSHINVLTLARAGPLRQSGLNAYNAVETCKHISEGYANLLRHTFGLSSDVHNTGHALDHKVVACFLRPWAVLAKPCHRAIDQFWIVWGQCRVIETKFFQAANFEVFN